MKYVVVYDPMFDEKFQIELEQIPANMPQWYAQKHVADEPWPDLPIKPRYRSERHPGWEAA
jgi:hypothetical protein